jgi:predicted enzyme related to lactoylglutathione lyase
MSTFSLSKIGQIQINVEDVERATVFYRDTLGMTYLFQVPGMSFFDCGGIMLMLGIPTSEEFKHPSSIVYYQVDDIAAAHKTLVERRVAFTEDPNFVANMGEQDLWMGFFQDTEGNTLAIRTLVPKGTRPV